MNKKEHLINQLNAIIDTLDKIDELADKLNRQRKALPTIPVNSCDKMPIKSVHNLTMEIWNGVQFVNRNVLMSIRDLSKPTITPATIRLKKSTYGCSAAYIETNDPERVIRVRMLSMLDPAAMRTVLKLLPAHTTKLGQTNSDLSTVAPVDLLLMLLEIAELDVSHRVTGNWPW